MRLFISKSELVLGLALVICLMRHTSLMCCWSCWLIFILVYWSSVSVRCMPRVASAGKCWEWFSRDSSSSSWFLFNLLGATLKCRKSMLPSSSSFSSSKVRGSLSNWVWNSSSSFASFRKKKFSLMSSDFTWFNRDL